MGWRDSIAKTISEGIRAYHSSPHDFSKVDLGKIGSGQGAASFGKGFYAAENPAVSGQGGTYWDEFLHKFPSAEQEAATHLRDFNFNRDAAIADTQQKLASWQQNLADAKAGTGVWSLPMAEKMVTGHQDILNRLQSGQPIGPRTYELNIRATPDQFLDWDKPLSAQPNIQDALYMHLLDRMGRRAANSEIELMERAQGMPLYTSFGKDQYDMRGASQALLDQGIVGNRYLDAGSRTIDPAAREVEWQISAIQDAQRLGGASPHQLEMLPQLQARLAELNATPTTSNYVIFDPGIVDIVKKYGIPGIATGGGVMGASAAQDQYDGAQQ